MGSSDTIFAGVRSAIGQQHLRKGAQESDSSSEELTFLQDQERRSYRRHLHESDLHLPVLRSQCLDYLNELQRNAAELSRNATAWMPWNYRHTIDLAVEDRPG